MKSFSVARKLSTIERRKEQNCFGEKFAGTEVTMAKTFLDSSFDEDVAFGDDNIFLSHSAIRIQWSGLWQAFEQ
jgi:hypothetical protein